jgi:hypothetical protein
VVCFPQVSQLKPCMHLSSPPYVPHVLPISVLSLPGFEPKTCEVLPFNWPCSVRSWNVTPYHSMFLLTDWRIQHYKIFAVCWTDKHGAWVGVEILERMSCNCKHVSYQLEVFCLKISRPDRKVCLHQRSLLTLLKNTADKHASVFIITSAMSMNSADIFASFRYS